MFRSVVFRHEGTCRIHVNNELGLEPYSNYTVKEHLEDLAGDGLSLIASDRMVHLFDDDSVQILEQATEAIELSRMDEDTTAILLASAAGWHGDFAQVERGLCLAC